MTALLFAPFVWLLLLAAVFAPLPEWWRNWRARGHERATTTYGVFSPNAPLEDITRHDRDALLAQGWVEIEIAAAAETTPLYDQTVCEEIERREWRADS